MQDSRPTSHRPASITDNLATAAVITGVTFMALDTFFTVKKGLKVFNTGDFLVNLATALGWALFCAIVQKAIFSAFIDSRGRQKIDRIWNAGVPGKAAIIILSCVAFIAIQFSFTSTSQALGINAKSLGINLPGQEYAASVGLIQFFIATLSGLIVAFIDEICFFCAELIKND